MDATPAEANRSRRPNRLAAETSPYLLQHAYNPVDWYAWGPEAFEAARAGNKPIFVSVGYSTCYWCHVMERQSFENDSIAAVMNDLFINIKVDREERPDVDQLYMTAVQVLTHQGGWPMSVFLTPDLRPFYGGTYFPPEDAYGRPGFPSLLRGIDDAFHNRLPEVNRSADQLVNVLRQIAEPPAPIQPITIDEPFIERLIARSIADYEHAYGGFGGAPKFPRQTLLEMLLVYLRETTADAVDPHAEISNLKAEISKRVFHSLDAMAYGGIRDHLGGAFHRYSTDAKWLVPHFEIMLYDNAMLGWIYVEAYQQTENLRYANIARGIFDFILREMTSPQGAFYTAIDAEVDAQEGLSYLWTGEQVRRTLTDEPHKGMGSPFSANDAGLFAKVFGLDQGPNFVDPHHGGGTPDKNILFVADPRAYEENYPLLRRMSDTLYEARRARKQPLLDTKVITSWNALMIRALAYGGNVLADPRYTQAAERAAGHILQHHLLEDGTLYRASRDGKAKYAGFLDDYAFLSRALVSLHDAGGDERWRDSARSVAAVMRRKFMDDERGGFFFTEAGSPDMIVRQKVGTDSPLPSGNAAAASALLGLDEPQDAARTIGVFARMLDASGEGMSAMLEAAIAYFRRYGPMTVSAEEAVDSLDESDLVKAPAEIAQGVVRLHAEWVEPDAARVSIEIEEGYHLQAHKTAAGLVGTDVLVDGLPETAVEIDYPPGTRMELGFSDAPVNVYDGRIELLVRFKVEPARPIRVGLRYQACDDAACLPPTTIWVETS